ncbi:FAD-binding oxidoreductase [Magnetospira sp. QH-2]|uniref:FAD-binding oxidoreductase n=1 Tax=Magnetospira sp. (strain QH-2) TaxID=1288970 RepID=UPI0003E8141D|nr:FAD-binding oxidoreductase [Magnetospira sp. QH-2]CCQ75461.1 conserved protein of unknown function[Include FAD binding domain] [Magnetospira sp. QH-2]
MRIHGKTLEGWALRDSSDCAVLAPDTKETVESIKDHFADRTVISRGGGASYGDPALNDRDQGLVVDLCHLNRILSFDQAKGLVQAEAGVQVVDLQAAVVPNGWFIPTTPGASQATLAGCLAFDVHGKNHEVQGTFGNNVTAVSVLTASGEIVSCSKDHQAELFWATVGGMGLTGVILDLTIQLLPVPSAYMATTLSRTANFDQTFAAQFETSSENYSVTWLDPIATGPALGRGIVMKADHARPDQLSRKQSQEAFLWPQKPVYRFPWTPDYGLFRPLFLRGFNSLYYWTHGNASMVQHAFPYLFPLHKYKDINRLYGRNGFYEYQVAVPEAQAYDLILKFLTAIQSFKAGSFLTIIKRFGKGNPAPMSFPIEGVTFSIQVLANNPGVREMLDDFDALTAKAGGRVYLAKDSRLVPELIDEMYPRRRQWAETLDQFDPRHIFESNMSRRLNLRNTD